MLYESPGGNQVDGSPPVPTSAGSSNGAKHSPSSRNAGRPFGQKSRPSDLVGFLRFIHLGSQVCNGAIESVQTCTIIKAYKLPVCANIIENHRHTKVHVWIRTWCEASSISECWAALRAEIDTFRSGGTLRIIVLGSQDCNGAIELAQTCKHRCKLTMHFAMDLGTCLFVSLVCQRKLPARSLSFHIVCNAVHHQS